MEVDGKYYIIGAVNVLFLQAVKQIFSSVCLSGVVDFVLSAAFRRLTVGVTSAEPPTSSCRGSSAPDEPR